MTYKELVDRIEDAVTRHKMLVDFGYGQLSDIKVLDNSDDGADYPYAFLLPTGIARANQAVTYSFSLIVMEMALNPRQILEVQSNCVQYINDLIADLRFDSTFDGDVSLTQSIQVFRERFQDEVAGATLNLQVTVADQIDRCEAPVLGQASEIVYATHLSSQVLGPDLGENKVFQFTNEIVDKYNAWSVNRFTTPNTGDYKIEVSYLVTFDELEPGEVFPNEPVLNYFPAGGGNENVTATQTIGWPETPIAGVTYPVTQVWTNLERVAGSFEFVSFIDQPFQPEGEMTIDAGCSLKIYEYSI